MDGSKLIELIKTLTKEEIKSFGNYLLAFNRDNSGVVLLYKYLKKIHPEFPPKKIEKKFVYNKIFDGKSFDSKRMRNLMSLLYLDLEKFLLGIELEENEIERDFLMLNVLRKRKQDKQFFLKTNQLKKKWKSIPNQGIDRYFNEFKLAQLYYRHPNASLYEKTQINIYDVNEFLDNFYFATKLFYAVCLLHRSETLADPDETREVLLLDEINGLKGNEFFKDNKHIEIFGDLFDSFKCNDYSNSDQLKGIYFNNINLFSEAEQHDIFLFLQACLYEIYKQGNSEFLKEIFNLNKFVVEKNILLEDDIIANEIFRNIVQLGCSVKEFEWVENFIANYQEKLDEEKREDIVNLCKAMLAFAEGKFEKTLDCLLLVKFQDVLYGIHVRCLMLQCYYELEDYEELFMNLTNAFSVFLSRNKMIAENVKKASLNFIQLSKKLFNLKLATDESLTKVSKEIADCVIVLNKKWLTKKAKELSSDSKQFLH